MYSYSSALSIHAPTRGATKKDRQEKIGKNAFNPRSYKRSDDVANVARSCNNLSIHAPTRGATFAGHWQTSRLSAFNPRSYKRSDASNHRHNERLRSFNPRSYKRSDGQWLTLLSETKYFQSTLLQEERQSPEHRHHRGTSFNPRSYKRSDYSYSLCTFISMLSIHDPTRGATRKFSAVKGT